MKRTVQFETGFRTTKTTSPRELSWPASDSCWLSVVMPVHQGENWLPATLASLAEQDCTGIEVILIDSSEDTACEAIAMGFSDRLDIRYTHRPDIKSWTAKTNLAARHARAAHIAMLHQDDLWLPGRVECIRKALLLYSEAAMIIAPSVFVGPDGSTVGKWSLPFPTGVHNGHTIGRGLLVQEVIALPAPVFRRDKWLMAGGLDENLWYTPDWDLYLKVSGLGPVAVLPQPTTAFRLHGNSLTMTGSRDIADFRRQLEVVLARHTPIFADSTDVAHRKRCHASVAINCGLARIAAGDSAGWREAILQLLALGPVGAWRYLRESRIIDRAWPRLRLRLAGAL